MLVEIIEACLISLNYLLRPFAAFRGAIHTPLAYPDTRRLRRWKEQKLSQASGQQRDIIAEYDTPGSTAFAPLTRQGADIDHLRGQPRRLQLPYLETRRGNAGTGRAANQSAPWKWMWWK